MRRHYATLVEQLEDAVIEFGVDAALEYFATRKDKRHLWDKEREKEKELMQLGKIHCKNCNTKSYVKDCERQVETHKYGEIVEVIVCPICFKII